MIVKNVHRTSETRLAVAICNALIKAIISAAYIAGQQGTIDKRLADALISDCLLELEDKNASK